MKLLNFVYGPTNARWDGSRVLFAITHDGGSFPCAISRAALEELGARRFARVAELLSAFEDARDAIEGLARTKLGARPAGVSGRLSLWADDVDDSAPPVGARATQPIRPLASGCAIAS